MSRVQSPPVIDTTRRYPRDLREAFPGDFKESALGIERPHVIETRPTLGARVARALREFKVWEGPTS